MSDRASAALTVWEVAGKEEQIAAVVNDHGFSRGFSLSWGNESGPVQPNEVIDGMRFIDSDAVLGVVEELAADLEPLGISFIAAQDAKFEYDGQVIMATPTLGRYWGTISQEGAVLVPARAVDCEIDAWQEHGEDYRELLAALDALTGRPWREHFAELERKQAAALAAQSQEAAQ